MAVFFTAREAVSVYHALVLSGAPGEVRIDCRLNLNVENPVIVPDVDIEADTF